MNTIRLIFKVFTVVAAVTSLFKHMTAKKEGNAQEAIYEILNAILFIVLLQMLEVN